MPALLVLFFFQVLRLLFDDRSNPANDATALSRQAEEFAASGNYSMAEKKLLALVVMAERPGGMQWQQPYISEGSHSLR